MSKSPGLALVIATAATLFQVACVDVDVVEHEEVGEARQSVMIDNALLTNALLTNSLLTNSLLTNSLLTNSLLTNSLLTNSLLTNALQDPEAVELLRYIASCALPSGAHFDIEVDGEIYGFDGGIGLAPEWGVEGGSCDETCQSWVSGCVLSRLNYLGETVTISVRGKHEGLHATLEERETFTHREATYYGNIFEQPMQVFACLSPGQTQIPRVCGPDIDLCVLDVVGQCDDVCGPERADGSFTKCREGSVGHKKGDKHVGSVTVFLDP
jgi:hypothetical protein